MCDNQISINEQKKVMLDILISFHNFCEENKLCYSLSSGTLLGAIRHKGYIPWDDDVDVCMPRKDYEFFKNNFMSWSKAHGTPFYKVYSEESRNFFWFFSKIVDDRSLVIEKNRREKIGLWIDVFPVDYVDKKTLAEKYPEIKQIIKKIIHLGEKTYYRTVLWNEGFVKALKNIFVNVLYFFKSIRLFKNKLKACYVADAKKIIFSKPGSENMCFYFPFIMDMWHQMPDLIIGGDAHADFEGYSFRIMSDYDSYLKIHYGDYMALPPKEKRVIHEKDLIIWKRK